MTIAAMEKILDGENQWSGLVNLREDFNFSLCNGTFVATITVQRSFDGGETWNDVENFTMVGEWVGNEPEGAAYRFGIKTGYYTSGSIKGRLAQ